MHAYTCIHTLTHRHTSILIHSHTHLHSHTHTYTLTHMLTLSHTRLHSHTHACTHTLRGSGASPSRLTPPVGRGAFKTGASEPQFWSLGIREGGVATLPGSGGAAANHGGPAAWPTAASFLSWPSSSGSPTLPAGLGRDEVWWRGSRGALRPVGAEGRGEDRPTG